MLDASVERVNERVLDNRRTLNNYTDVRQRGQIARTECRETHAKCADLAGWMGVVEVGVDERSRLREKQHRD